MKDLGCLYFNPNSTYSFNNGLKECKKMGGDLYEFTDSAKNATLYKYLKSNSG